MTSHLDRCHSNRNDFEPLFWTLSNLPFGSLDIITCKLCCITTNCNLYSFRLRVSVLIHKEIKEARRYDRSYHFELKYCIFSILAYVAAYFIAEWPY